MDLKKIQEMIQPKASVPDNTKQQAFEVFNDKSQEGDTIKNNALISLKNLGMTEEDILGIAMGSVGGAGKLKGVMGALKGIGGGLKGLAGKIGSKAKFPKGYGAPQSPRETPKLPTFIQNKLNKAEPNPFKQEAIKQQEIRKALNQLMQPNTVIKEEGIKKGMRQFGKFNRQLNK